MYIKIHETQERKIISICDEDLIGKTFEEKDLQLKVSERFYKGEKLSEEKILEEIKSADYINLVGKNSINFAIKNKLILKENIIKIQNIPHAISILK